MSGRIVGEVLNNAPSDLTTAQLLVFLSLAEDAHDAGVYPRIARNSSLMVLTSKTRLKPGSVKNILATLTSRGLIKPLHRGQAGTVQHYLIPELFEYHRDAFAHQRLGATGTTPGGTDA